MSMLPRAPVLVLLVALAVGACSDDEPGPASASDPVGLDADAPFVVEFGAPSVSCGGSPGWPPSIMADGVPAPLSDEEMVGIFRALLADPEVNGELQLSFLAAGAEATEWRMLVGDSYQMTLGLGNWTDEGPAEGSFVFGLEREGERWRWTGGGDCHLRPVLKEGHSWVDVETTGVNPKSSEPSVQVTEMQCASARRPDDYLHEPYVVETDESVTVYWTSDPVVGAANCPGNPSVTRTIRLDEPLGDRELLDGSTYPPSPIR